MVNLQIRQFRDTIVSVINTCQLPIEIKRLVFAEIQTHINQEADMTVITEIKQQKEESKKEDKQEEKENE